MTWQLFSVELQTCFHCADVSAGEGYECTVTVDDEDSKIIVFDNWKQASSGRASCPYCCCVFCGGLIICVLLICMSVL